MFKYVKNVNIKNKDKLRKYLYLFYFDKLSN